jgi:hypothetical protein
MTLLNMLWHEWRCESAPWRDITKDRPSRARGALIECPCGKRWLSRYPWDRVAGFHNG